MLKQKCQVVGSRPLWMRKTIQKRLSKNNSLSSLTSMSQRMQLLLRSYRTHFWKSWTKLRVRQQLLCQKALTLSRLKQNPLNVHMLTRQLSLPWAQLLPRQQVAINSRQLLQLSLWSQVHHKVPWNNQPQLKLQPYRQRAEGKILRRKRLKNCKNKKRMKREPKCRIR